MSPPTFANEKKQEADFDVAVFDSDRRSSIDTITALVTEDHQHEIKLRTMSWQKAAWLLAGDQVCLAIMAQTWSLSSVCPRRKPNLGNTNSDIFSAFWDGFQGFSPWLELVSSSGSPP
jgi:hypothetical protein